MKRFISLFTLAGALTCAGVASAQDGAVPRGADGAVKKAPDEAPPAASKRTPPKARNYAPPDYPPDAKAKGIEGQVILELTIDATGKVTNVTVLQPAGNGFDEAAVAAGKKLEFDPALNDAGVPSPSLLKYRYDFTLRETPTDDGGTPPAAPVESLGGQVLAEAGDVPIVGAVVSVAGGAEQTTNAEGGFTFAELAPGAYQVTISAPGYEPLVVTEEVVAGQGTQVRYRLIPQGDGLEVFVRGERPPREVVKRTLQAREIARIPGTNGDALRSLQNLPGVARPPGIAGLLLVRGSGPADSQTSIDGTFVPLIYHFGGLSSVVPTEVLDKIDFYPGNFGAEYGRVQGGIVDVALRKPRDDGYHGLLQLDLVDVRGLVEGPIPLLDGWTFMIGARRSYIDAWLGPVLEAAGAGVTQAPVYYDYQVIAEHNSADAGRFRAAFFGSDDALELLIDQAPGDPGLSGNIGLGTSFQRLQLLYENEIGEDGKFRGVMALGNDDIEFGLGPFFFLLNSKTLSGKLEVSQRIAKGVTLNFGTDLIGGVATVDLRLPAPGRPGEPPGGPFSTRKTFTLSTDSSFFFPAVYAEAEIVPDERFRVVPGVRVDLSTFNDAIDVSPRLTSRYDIVHDFPRSTIKGGIGYFHQPPQFQQVVEPLGNPDLESERAIHYALGYEQEITRNIEASVEGFVKQLDNVVVGEPSDSGFGSTYSNKGSGYVVGSEVLLKYKPDDRFFGWLAYTVSRSARQNAPDEDEYLVFFDQTHILTVLGSVKLGHGWEFGTRFRLVSGNLTTPSVCDPLKSGCNVDRTNALFASATGTYTPIPYSGFNSERLPLFHQLDLRVDKVWHIGKVFKLSTYLDVQNVYNNQNAEAIGYNFDYTARNYVSGLPILPSIGVRGEL